MLGYAFRPEPAAPSATTVQPFATAAKPRGRPTLAAAAVLVALAGLTATGWLWQRAAERHAREQTIPEVARLVDADDYEAAFTLAADARKHLSSDPLLERLTPQFTSTFAVTRRRPVPRSPCAATTT